MTLALWVALAGVPVVISLGRAPLRRALMIENRTRADTSTLKFTSDPVEAAAFFRERDSVVIRVPRDMTVNEFLALYHLRTSSGAREALKQQVGSAEPTFIIAKGKEIAVNLTQVGH